MIALGEFQQLVVLRSTPQGFYLIDDTGDEVLLPNKYIADDLELEDKIEVFVYTDSEDRPIATTLAPNLIKGQFNYLKVKDVNAIGAFMDWGLEKDLLVPFKNQRRTMEVGEWHCIYLYLDQESDRLVGSAKINHFLSDTPEGLTVGTEVDLLICEKTDLGVNVIINQSFKGLIYHSDIFEDIRRGDHTKAYIKSIREDGKVDVSLNPIGVENTLEPNAQKVVTYLKKSNGVSSLTDKSSPDLIYNELGMSKKAFKRALGNLYKEGKVKLSSKETILING